MLANAELEFKVLREQLGVSDAVLSKHLKSLEGANYVILNKRTDIWRQRTWVSLSTDGRRAYDGHLKALKALKAVVGSV